MSRIAIVLSISSCLFLCSSAQSRSGADINAKVAQIDIGSSSLDDVVGIFGEPTKYAWGGKTFTKNNLPRVYIAAYPKGFFVAFVEGKVNELRFERPEAGYVFRNRLKMGSSLEEVLGVLGTPKETVVGKGNGAKDGVLYKDIDGKKGYCYYSRADQNIRLFFQGYRVISLYLTGSDSGEGGGGAPRAASSITSVAEFDDVRSKDMSSLDLSGKGRLITTLRFNEDTKWPSGGKMPVATDPKGMMIEAMSPGLGVRSLQLQGITGKGVNVAIVDQPLYKDHPEFAGKILAYHDVGCGKAKSSMHGPAVASLLVGSNCGTAPGARVYYVAAPSWTKDTAYQAKALDWIVEQNRRLPKTGKIRVVSVSAAPSGGGSPFEKNLDQWDRACQRAEGQGILVLDCTSHRGLIGPCFLDRRQPEDVTRCRPGFPNTVGPFSAPTRVLAPTCPRTTAEQYEPGEFSYAYWGNGGLSWAIPYSAGVLAMGWQVRPDLGPQQMRELLFESAFVRKDGNRIIDPKKFIELVRKAPRSP